MALFNIMSHYHDDLMYDPEFECSLTRNYYIVVSLRYKGRPIKLAIPLRSNINIMFQRRSDEIVATVPTKKTRPGCIAGFHITKAIPVNGAVLVKNNYDPIKRLDLKLAETVAESKYAELREKAQAYLNRVEAGENIFGAVDIDAALVSLQRHIDVSKAGKSTYKRP